MPRPQSLAAQQGRTLDKLIKNSPWLDDEEKKQMAALRDSLVKTVAKSAEGKRAMEDAALLDKTNVERPLSGARRG